jgi:hypothetical protein
VNVIELLTMKRMIRLNAEMSRMGMDDHSVLMDDRSVLRGVVDLAMAKVVHEKVSDLAAKPLLLHFVGTGSAFAFGLQQRVFRFVLLD